jgi:hypothetical protein
MALQEGINLLNKAKNLSGQSALAVLEQVNLLFYYQNISSIFWLILSNYSR